MKETPQTETTGDIEKNRRDAQAILERRARRRPGSERDVRIRERAWVLYRDRSKGVDKEALPQLGKECLAQATAFEETVDEVLGTGDDAGPEYIEEPGQPFGPALRPSERGTGVVGQPDVPRLDPSEVDGMHDAVDAAETFLEGGNRND